MEKEACDTFIRTQLLADAALKALVTTHQPPAPDLYRIYEAGVVPESAPFPYVMFSLLSMLDRNALPAVVTIFTRPVYYVRAVVTGGNLRQGYDLADRIDVALRGKSGNVVLASGTYYVGPWMRNAIRQLPTETEGTMRFNQIGIEVESRVEKIA